MRPTETILEPERWSLEQVLDATELLLLFLSPPEREEEGRVGFLHRGRLRFERDSRGTPKRVILNGAPLAEGGIVPRDCHCAPELLSGAAAPSLRTDLYLLGVLLYELLSGQVFPAYAYDGEPVRRLRRIPGVTQILDTTLRRPLRDNANVAALIDAVMVARSETVRQVTSVEIGQASQVGVASSRLRNQDATGAATLQLIGASRATLATLLVLADGMGSTEGGALVAERLVREGQKAFIEAFKSDEDLYHYVAEHTRRIGIEAIQATLSAMRTDPKLAVGGSTWVGGLIVGDRFSLGWLGDSRAYILPAAGGIVSLTSDHGLVGAAHAAGRFRDEELDTNPFRHIIYRAVLGAADPNLIPSYLDTLADTFPGQSVLTLSPGDQIALVSDGVSGELPDPALERLIREAPTAHAAAHALCAAAQATPGSSDNTSALIARPCFTPAPALAPIGPVGRRR